MTDKGLPEPNFDTLYRPGLRTSEDGMRCVDCGRDIVTMSMLDELRCPDCRLYAPDYRNPEKWLNLGMDGHVFSFQETDTPIHATFWRSNSPAKDSPNRKRSRAEEDSPSASSPVDPDTPKKPKNVPRWNINPDVCRKL